MESCGAEIPRMVFTGSLAVVDQDVILFEDSITENIRIWDKSIEDFEIIMAARDAQIPEDIMSLRGRLWSDCPGKWEKLLPAASASV